MAARHRHRTARAHGESGLGGLLRSDLLRLEHSSRNLFGAALGNVVRGVPLGADDISLSRCGRISEWARNTASSTGIPSSPEYRVSHANCARRTLHRSEDRERTEPARARGCAVGLAVAVHLNHRGLIATCYVRPMVLDNYKQHAIGYLIPVVVFGSLGVMIYAIRKGWTNLPSSAPLFTSLECWWVRPLRSIRGSACDTNPAYNLTIYNTAAARHGLNVASRGGSSPWFLLWDISLSCSACSGEGEAGRGRLLSLRRSHGLGDAHVRTAADAESAAS